MNRSLLSAFGLMLLATSVIVIGDSSGRILGQVGFSPLFVAWSRFAIAAILLLPFSGLRMPELSGLLDWRVILRSALICAAICSILMALQTEPLANAFGGFFIGPIVSYFLSALVLKEQISIPRTLLLGLGFVGVLVVVRPGFGMTIGMGFAVMAGVFHGTYLMTTKLLVAQYRPRFLLISQLIIGAILLLPFSTFEPPEFTTYTTILIVVSALGSAMGNLITLMVNKTTPASVVAPLIYTQLISATIIGYIVFKEFPDALTLIGLIVILGSGFSSLWFAGKGR